MSSPEVVLGFLEEAEWWRLRSPQFPSKVGGKPAWLCQRGPPSGEQVQCGRCGLPMAFLLQVYAPISGQDSSFHRTLFLFCCKTPECYKCNDSCCMKVFRSQLERKNDFYPYEPPPEDDPPSGAEDEQKVLSVSGVKLCWVCGCPGNKACSRCHNVTYCGKHHQTLHWKQSHKKECCSQETSIERTCPFLFPESELITEPEDVEKEETNEADEEDEEDSSIQKCGDCPSVADSRFMKILSYQLWERLTWRRWQCMKPKTIKCSSSLKGRSAPNHTKCCDTVEGALHCGCPLSTSRQVKISHHAPVELQGHLSFR